MEFWGVEVKPGEVLTCDPGDDKYLHISQAALGEIQNTKGNERVPLYVHADDKKIVIGTLLYGKCDQLSLDLVFDREFKLSHSCTAGSVFFSGYTTLIEEREGEMEGSDDDTDSDSEDEPQEQALRSRLKENGQTEAKPVKTEVKKDEVKPAKPEPVTTGKASAKAKPEEAKPVSGQKLGQGEESSDEDEEEDEDEDEDEDESMEDASDEGAESDESEGDSDEESEEDKSQKTPKTAGNKRPLLDSATDTPGTNKKAKTMTPSGTQKPGTDGGRKDGPKTPGVISSPGSKGQKGQTPKAQGTPGSKETPKPLTTPSSGKKVGEHVCTPCSRNFATQAALSQHNAAKHGGK